MVRNHLQIDLVKDMALHIADCFLQADVLSLYFLDSCSGGEVVQKSEHLMAGTDAKLPGLAQTLVPHFLEEEAPVCPHFDRVHGLKASGQLELLGTIQERGVVGKAFLNICLDAVDGFAGGDEQRTGGDCVAVVGIGKCSTAADKVVQLELTLLVAVHPLVPQEFLLFMHLKDKNCVQ